MGLFNSFSQEIAFLAVKNFSDAIVTTQSFKYFSAGDSNMIREYKDFETTMIASAMTFIAFKWDLKNEDHKKNIQTIYIGMCAPFLTKLISKEYELPEFEIDEEESEWTFKSNIEAIVCLETHVKFEKYLKELKKSFEENSAYYFIKYDKAFDYMGEDVFGENAVYNYLINILLAKEYPNSEDSQDDSLYIGHREFEELNEEESELLNSFCRELKLSFNK